MTLVLLGGCFSKPAGPVDLDSAWLENFAFRKPITIHRATDALPLTDFMLSIAELEDVDIAAHALLNGGDVVFTDADGVAPLEFELADYTAQGAIDAWLRVPTLPAGDSTVYLYYGGAPGAPTLNPWPASYLGVWHMSGRNPDRETDATHHVADLLPSDPTTETPLVGVGLAGKARDYQVPTADLVGDELCATTSGIDVAGGPFTLSLWYFVRSDVSLYDCPFSYGGQNENEPGFAIELGNDNVWAFEIGDGDGTLMDQQDVPLPVVHGRWVHLAVVVARPTTPEVNVYANGTLDSATPLKSMIGAIPLTAHPLCIGSDMYRFDGLIDEVQVMLGTWDKAALRAHYQNLAFRSSFQTFGAEQAK